MEIKNPKHLICEDCGKKDETVQATTCPYAEEIFDELVDVVLCLDCMQDRADDI